MARVRARIYAEGRSVCLHDPDGPVREFFTPQGGVYVWEWKRDWRGQVEQHQVCEYLDRMGSALTCHSDDIADLLALIRREWRKRMTRERRRDTTLREGLVMNTTTDNALHGLAQAYAQTMLVPGADRPWPAAIGYRREPAGMVCVMTFEDDSTLEFPVDMSKGRRHAR